MDIKAIRELAAQSGCPIEASDEEMRRILKMATDAGCFDPLPPLTVVPQREERVMPTDPDIYNKILRELRQYEGDNPEYTT